MEKDRVARVIAYYLPQFHPIPENDAWWGKGFTEWTNVGKAKPLFKGHYQPRVPADLGYYDLRMPEVREAQAQLAREAGIEGFCYWHYWFGNGNRLLARPFDEVLESGKPDFPFCLGWANHSWTNTSWEKGTPQTKNLVLMEQKYSDEDYRAHFDYALQAFRDDRYICVDNKPVFVVFDPLGIPEANHFIELWNSLAVENGLKGVHFVGIISSLSGFRTDENGNRHYYPVKASEPAGPRYRQVLNLGFDAVNSRGLFRAELIVKGRWRKLLNQLLTRGVNINFLHVYRYEQIIKHLFVDEDSWENVYPTLLPNWDRSARSGRKAVIYHDSNPKLFGVHIKNAIDCIKMKDNEHKILFLMSWNEWAEGNYIEPDLKFGTRYLEILRDNIMC